MADPDVPRLEGCLVIANPRAGAVTEALITEVTERCARYTDVRVVRTGSRGDATRLVAMDVAAPHDGGLRVVVAMGGDGTVLEVVNGMVTGDRAADGVALLIVPAGTGNSNYRAHWGERPWQDAVDQALGAGRPAPSRLDLARVRETGELIVLGAGAGLTAEVLSSARDIPLSGKDRLKAGLEHAAARFSPYAGRVTVDGVVVHKGDTVLANVGGGRHRAWRYLVLPHSELDDGLLDVCVVGADTDPGDVPALLLGGEHVGRPGVVYATGRSVTFERTDGLPLCFEHDGELAPDAGSRRTIDVLPAALPVLCATAARPDRR
ncbi:diacylglycerol kinase family protein [Streptomyces sp. NPDC037389]|uniref:diacylglycerol/lipid kinase family protein n=1 Tax=Streptomyces sp. NPDC037389 TaxID=3155369 RepID=UPI00340A0028